MTTQPRISDFWLDPTRTIDRPDVWEDDWDDDVPVGPDRSRFHAYAMERIDGLVTVHRFIGPFDRSIWVAEGNGTRESLPAKHPLVRQAKKADDWPDEDDE